MDKQIRQWERTIDSQTFLISSDPDLLPHSFIQEAFATEAMFWASPMSDEALRAMLSQSLTIGLYLLSPSGAKEPIGMSRMVTDYTTVAYLTDVYLLEPYRAFGLGRWMIHCCRELALEMPALRFLVLMAGNDQAQRFYRKELGMQLLDGKEQALTCMGVRKAKLADVAAAVSASQSS